jgi:soluble lytic murein transglycosylase-like protein
MTYYNPPKRRFQRLYSAIALSCVLASLTVLLSFYNHESPTEDLNAQAAGLESLDPQEYRNLVLASRNPTDPLLTLYRDAISQEDTVAFLAAITHSEPIARLILHYSSEYEVSPALAVGLSWEESRFTINAINRNTGSIDRGLFQLNSKSFPNLSENEFFDPETNIRHGIAHLRWCLDIAGTDVSGLAMYNAGTTRVRSNTTPKVTLDYVSRILSFKEGVLSLYESQLANRYLIAQDGSVRPLAPMPRQEIKLALVGPSNR